MGEVGQGVRTGLGHGGPTSYRHNFLAFIIFVVVKLIRGGQIAMASAECYNVLSPFFEKLRNGVQSLQP